MRVIIHDRKEMEDIVRACKTCSLAICDDGKPYIVPMSFALYDNSVILHSGREGRLWKTLQKNKNVCINWVLGETITWQDVQVGCSYSVKSRSVTVEGQLEIIEDFDEKYKLLQAFMTQYSDREFKFNEPAVNHVVVYKVPATQMTARALGVRHPNSQKPEGGEE